MKGIDIDWVYPCSPALTDPVKITCGQFRAITDAGNSGSADKNNLLPREGRWLHDESASATVLAVGVKYSAGVRGLLCSGL